MRHANKKARFSKIRLVIISGLLGLIFSGGLIACYWAIGLKNIAFFKQFDESVTNVSACLCVLIAFLFVSIVSFSFLAHKQTFKNLSEVHFPLSVFCKANLKSFGFTAALLLVLWIPVLILFFPGIITYDGIIELSEYASSRLANHHPVFDTLLYGFFVYTLGGFIGSQNIGLFFFVVFQSILTASSLAAALCYLEHLDITHSVRLLSLLFVLFCPLFSINSVTMLKDTLHAPLFLLFFLIYIHNFRTNGDALRSRHIFWSFLILSCLCMLTKKTGMYIVFPSLLVLWIKCKSVKTGIVAFFPAIITVFCIPLFLWPLIGGVANGGKQEALALPLQQTVAIAKFEDDMTSDERKIIETIIDLEQAKQSFNPNRIDPVKSRFNSASSLHDILSYLTVYSAQGLRHPILYLRTMLQCTGSLYAPIEGMNYYIGIAKKTILTVREKFSEQGLVFNCTLNEPENLSKLVKSIRNSYHNAVLNWPIAGFLLSKGLYGGWIPLFCLVMVLFLKPKKALVYTPIVLTSLLLAFCPVDDARYVFPLLYCAPLIIGYMIHVQQDTNQEQKSIFY